MLLFDFWVFCSTKTSQNIQISQHFSQRLQDFLQGHRRRCFPGARSTRHHGHPLGSDEAQALVPILAAQREELGTAPGAAKKRVQVESFSEWNQLEMVKKIWFKSTRRWVHEKVRINENKVLEMQFAFIFWYLNRCVEKLWLNTSFSRNMVQLRSCSSNRYLWCCYPSS